MNVGQHCSDFRKHQLDRVFVVHAPVNPFVVIKVGNQLQGCCSDFGRSFDVFTAIVRSPGKFLVGDSKNEGMIGPELIVFENHVLGHGSGSIKRLFEQASSGPAGGASAEVIANPHNQTLNVAVQWGMLGVIVLYAMWLSHLMLFRHDGLIAWIGLMVVVQNFVTSLFNSHLFDFNEGWMYVLGVGIAGGKMLQAGRRQIPAGTRNSVRA